ncbi:MAG: NAD(P)H-dependent oxidoreductase [Myxococcota bacterium]
MVFSVTLLDGAHATGDDVARLAPPLLDVLEARGATVHHYALRGERLAFCQGCFECWTTTPGVCKTRDVGRHLAADVARSDLLVVLTPVAFGGLGSTVKQAIDRLLGNLSPYFERIQSETHHQKRYAHYPSLWTIGVLPSPDREEELLFQEVTRRIGLNFHAPATLATLLPPSATAAEVKARFVAARDQFFPEAA